MAQQEKDFCFGTLALGDSYRALAMELAKDLEKYSPQTSFVILTDKPDYFCNQRNVLSFEHKQQSVGCYHDKKFVIERCLSLFNCCIYLDADMRILAPVPQDMEWIQIPGIKARACESLTKRYAKVLDGTANQKICKEREVVNKLAQKLSLNLEDENVEFVYEYLFVVTRECGKETEFLKQWEAIAPYFELNGIYDSEGSAIGLAAAKAGLPVSWDAMEGISFFKDRVELVKLKKRQSDPKEMSIYFEKQKILEYPKRSILKKISVKLAKNFRYVYRSLRLRIETLKNFDFYYR